MDKSKKIAANVDEYIAGFPQETQKLLQQVRSSIMKAVPSAEEAIKYTIPTYVYKGNLVSFAGYKTHIGLYPVPKNVDAFKKALAPYADGAATAKFPLDKPLPLSLIQKIVKFRVKQTDLKAKAKKGKR